MPCSALSFRWLLLIMGDFWAFFRLHDSSLHCRRLSPSTRSGFCLQFLVPDRSVSLVPELSAQFCGVR
ncbi:hypothetical protein SLEP1_g24859 [Rubroshorea leprosula]|uniref:Secreted protein n=1 Tax=Rubroshorea leprosula TaxID=152421 RepID=A0AAV5JGW6_9ROSI|nr:hypothetical protein SLEP1_g24859 [Rubroshorea leprosula]